MYQKKKSVFIKSVNRNLTVTAKILKLYSWQKKLLHPGRRLQYEHDREK